MMHRLLARSGADPESRAKVEQMQFQHGKSLRPRQFNLGYPGTIFFFFEIHLGHSVCAIFMEKMICNLFANKKQSPCHFFFFGIALYKLCI